MPAKDIVDIVIVGAGLVGATLACALASQKELQALKIIVIEPAPEPAEFSSDKFDPRVVALTKASQHLFEELNVWSEVCEKRACPYRTMRVWDGEGTASIEFHSRDFHQDNLGYIVENSLLLTAVLEKLKQYSNVEIVRGAELQSLQCPLSFDKKLSFSEQGPAALSRVLLTNDREIQTPLVLASDGANSKVRSILKMKTREWDYGHAAIVTTVRTEQPHQYTAWQRFIKTGPLAFLPLTAGNANVADEHHCSIVWSLLEDRVPAVLELDDAEFAKRLGEAFEFTLGEVEWTDRRFSFPLRQRHAINYIQPGVALLGDAAHTIHPLAGQGVNLGLLDVLAMTSELLRAQQRDIPLHDPSILKRYQRARLGGNLGMMGIMEGFKRLFGSTQPLLHVARNAGMRETNHLPHLKNAIAKRAMGL